MNYIKGNYRKSIFKSDKGYVIGLFKVRDTNIEEMQDSINKTITFTGYFHELNEDDSYIFYGEQVNHPRYGTQFQVSEYERITPKDRDGLIEFLASDLFPGVGEAMATSIIEKLGNNAIQLIIDDVSNLNDIPKLTSKKALKIHSILSKYEESHQIIVYLNEIGFNMRDSLTIYNCYKQNTIQMIEYNIYNLIDEVDVSFIKVDEIALKNNVKVNDERRIKACIIYIMKKLTFEQSDTYLDYYEIFENVYNYLKIDIDNDSFEQLFNSLIMEAKVVIEDKKYYLKEMYDSEINIVNKIKILSNFEITKYKKLDLEIETLEKDNNILYNEKQKKAIKKALENHLIIITGGPGTGKTTLIKAIVELYQKLNKLEYEELINEVALLAPTGRASKRMSETTLLPATTIHRFLKWNKETNTFTVNEENKNQSKLIIVDEVSMIDLNLLDSLFKGLEDNIRLVLVGDYNQLPSVGPGQILKDLIDSNVIDTIHLDLLYRQDENSYIPTLADEIKNNTLSETFLDTKSDYTFLECNSLLIKNSLKKVCEQIINKGYNYKKVQIMAPMYRGENGIDNLNIILQDVFNPKDPNKIEIKYGDIIFRENDKVLQLVNMPDENVFNGDIGVIKKIVLENNKPELHIDFDGNIVKYQSKDFIKIKHGFIISIHKSQGSEFDIVIMPICNSYKRMLYRKLIYTGITRAKKKLILIGEANAFVYAVENNNEQIRKTDLLNKIVHNLIN